ncbi:MAG: alpha/beta hydrolase [Acidobacteria bacterium]|nr:alpha/beta hydrolase [Acidobacteriota bacterium]
MVKTLVNGINVHYQIKGDGPDVVLVHGLTSTLAVWYTTILPALARDFRVTVYDLRGHGLTDLTPSGYTSREMAEDLVALMDHVGVEKARVVGHSFGGSVGLHLALLHPDRVDGVVLSDTGLAALRHLRDLDKWKQWGGLLSKYGISYRWLRNAQKKGDITDVIRKSFDIPQQFGFRKGASRATPRLRRLIDETNVATEFREVAGLTVERLPEVTAPVLALYGETSPNKRMAAYLSAAMPNCRSEILPDFGHFYLVQDPDLFLNRITDFLHDPSAYVARGVPPAGNETRDRKADGPGSETSYEERSVLESFSLDR